MNASLRHPVVWVFLTLTILSALWLALGSPIALITQIAIYVLYGAGVSLLVGYTGLVPFGASVFFGTASYVVAIVMTSYVANELVALALAVAFSVVLAAAIAVIILRRRGLYFSLLTLAFSQIAYEIAFKSTELTGGENGMQGVPRPNFTSDLSYHVFVVLTVGAVTWLLWRLAHAPFGRACQALRDNELRMRSLGYDAFGLKFRSFVIMGAVIGLGGGMLSLMLRGAYADNLSWQHAGDALLMTVLGGVHQFLGPLFGAIAFTLLEDKLSSLLEAWWLIFAPIIIFFALVSPEGIIGLIQRFTGGERWTLVRASIPARPAIIPPLPRQSMDADRDKPILSVRGLSKRFGSLVTANDIALDVHPFMLHSFIGPNGAGKTTFFNMLSGALPPNAGTIAFEGRDITRLAMHKRAMLGIGRSFQILSVFPQLSAFENVRVAVQRQRESAFTGLAYWLGDAHANEAINLRTWTLLDAVGLADDAPSLCVNLPHGKKRLLEIAITLATDARLLLLDEPLAGLAEADREVVGALIRKLADTHAVLLIEHDIDRVLSLSDRITVLHQGRLIADGKPAQVANDPAVIEAYLGAAETVKVTPLATGVGGSGREVLAVENLSVGYGGGTVLSGVSFRVREGEAVALLGRNGVGKTTLLRAISGALKPASGNIAFEGQDLARKATYEINRAGISLVPEGRRLFGNLTVTENLRLAQRAGGMSIEEIFTLFPRLRERQRARAENLSGGERQMVAIARALVVPSKLILLDEPFEGLAPAIVKEVMDALVRLRGRVAMVIVEHHAETVLPISDHAYVLVNGKVAYEGSALALQADHALQARLLGVVHVEELAA